MKPAALPETAEIVSLDHEGRGVARIDGKAVFVTGALPGESVLIQRTRRQRRHDEAELLEVLRPSPDRVAPRCPHFGVCGGCSLQHLAHPAQLLAKQQVVAEELRRIGGVVPNRWLAPLAGHAWEYRRRARLGCKYVDGKGRVLVGFRERGSPLLADLRQCEILAAPVGRLIEKLAALVGTLEIRRRVAQIEVAVAENATALVLRVLDDPGAADLEQLRVFAATESVELYLQRGGLETVTPLSPPATPLRYDLPGLPDGIVFAPTDFIQVNGGLNRRMIAQAIELLEPRATDRLLDLFCGLGNFSLPLARLVADVTGVEGDAPLVARATDNAARNGIANARFVSANLALDPGAAAWARQAWDLVLLDPPRAGAREVLDVVAASRPRRIVYVSCHAGTLARDAGILVQQQGYRMTAAGIMDMFPHTSHVEAVAVFGAGRMNLEIERKFLVKGDGWRSEAVASAALRQGYLANTATSSVRVRIAGKEGWLSVKAMRTGRSREEFEYAIPLEDANALLAGFVEGPLIEKTRHQVPVGDHRFEVDEFHGANRGLVVAEVELDHADEAFARPDWLGDEVTEDARFHNFRLAREPFGEWPAETRAAASRGARAR